jgi:hypothetical protein
MKRDEVLIDITAIGGIGKGKSLAIADMLQGLRDGGHFILGSEQKDSNEYDKEQHQIVLILKRSTV